MSNPTYYRALQTRDRRFDGRFFTAVRTTKIFCRPVCPAPTPKPENCEFFSSAAAAMGAGFRPCLRCRPELSPDLTPYLTTASSVNRALRLIGEGALDHDTVEALANRLGMGARHLRRLFVQHLGVTPIAVAQTRRILFAKQLIDDTALPMTDIAMAAGFGSIRRFNTAMQATYQKAPRDLRKLRVEPTSAAQDIQPEIQIKLPFHPPYAWEALVRFLQPRVTAGIEVITPDAYCRSIALAGQQGLVTVRPLPGAPYLLAQIRFPQVSALGQIVERLRQLFDLRANVGLIAAHLETDPDLRPWVKALPGLRVPGCWDGFELAVRVILGQQVTVAAATRMAGRLVQRYGEPLQWATEGLATEGLAYVFPTPASLAEADLTQIGLTSQRARAINVLAAQVAADPDFLTRTDLDGAQLCALPGIGPWTASYIAMRALREPDAFPASDLGLLKAMARLMGRPNQPLTQVELLQRSQAWQPWRAYAAMYLWQNASLANGHGFT
jgi:AraC family transcriptional regulator, regulatory protein of adaptative response / DNA-3-methyladenine glycosylase II